MGTLLLAASLTPTLLPRNDLTQGILSGCSFAAGYGIGVFGRWLWRYLEMPVRQSDMASTTKLCISVACALVTAAFLWKTTQWQNSIRELMRLDPVGSADVLKIGLIAVLTFALLLMIARLFQLSCHVVAAKVHRFLPRRVANVIGAAAAVALFWTVVNGVIFRAGLHLADASRREIDAMIDPEIARPAAPFKTGSSASLLAWEELGRAGREFISSGPSARQVQELTGKDAREPIRVYVGLRSAKTPEARAQLALEELKRVGGFDRAVLVVAMPTGTGWLDPAAMDSIEYLRGGDVASVAVQYSYLSSWLSLLVEPDIGVDTAHALFEAIYNHWTGLPKDRRPKLYLYGLSLGALNSEQSTEFFEVLGDPFSGALWVGPPSASALWRFFTANRNPGSPAWLPVFRDSSLVRFMNQNGLAAPAGARWGPMRIVYLQHASDPVTFLDYRLLFRKPAWMALPRGPDVSPSLRWYPVVSFLQLALDMAMATSTPIGYGHVYDSANYVDAWIEVTDVRGWSAREIARLKRHLAKPRRVRG